MHIQWKIRIILNRFWYAKTVVRIDTLKTFDNRENVGNFKDLESLENDKSVNQLHNMYYYI